MTRLETFRRHLLSTVTLSFPAMLGFWMGPGVVLATAVRAAKSKAIERELESA